MYTQCKHCKAIFHVSMREVTVAKGNLRCGECLKIFNATQTLSTTLPKKFEPESINPIGGFTDIELIDIDPEAPEDKQTGKTSTKTSNYDIIDGWDYDLTASREKDRPKTKANQPEIQTKPQQKPKRQKVTVSIEKKKRNISLVPVTILLSVLLLSQILYNYRHIILNTPQRNPEKVLMLNHNVFMHPNESGVLLITASIENTADHPQPFPVLELSLSNAQSKIIALRRFLPEEYLENYTNKMLLPSKTPTSLKLKIKDPGNSATRFQFDFL